MPTYEYRCPNGHEFEVFQRMSDEPVASCPECGREAERLLSTGAGLLFKGSGFYVTDYRSDDYQKAVKAEEGGGGKGSSGKGGTDSSSPASETSGGSGDGSGKKGTED